MGWGPLYVDFSRLSVDCFVVKVLVGMPWKVAMVEVLGKVKVSGCGEDFSFFIPLKAFNFLLSFYSCHFIHLFLLFVCINNFVILQTYFIV